MLRAVFDALPSLVFVVDQDVRIQEYNAAVSVVTLFDGDGITHSEGRAELSVRR